MGRLRVPATDKLSRHYGYLMTLMKSIQATEVIVVFDGHGDSGAWEVWGVKIKNRYWKFGPAKDDKERIIPEPIMRAVFDKEEWVIGQGWVRTRQECERSLSDLALDMYEHYVSSTYGGYYDGSGAYGEMSVTSQGIVTKYTDYQRQPSTWKYKLEKRRRSNERTEVKTYEAPLTPMEVLAEELSDNQTSVE